jgi:N-acetylmuramoyl-L-alanine amidase
VAGIGVTVSTMTAERPTAADLPTPSIEQPAVVTTPPAENTATPEPTATPARYQLSASERDTVERVVMAEAGGESFAGQMLVAQCILNAAEKEGVQPSEAVVIYSYTSSRPDPTQSVKDAVAAVFDRGEVAIDAPVMYFYNPALVTSDWHESQIFVAEVGGHRFFAERSPNA